MSVQLWLIVWKFCRSEIRDKPRRLGSLHRKRSDLQILTCKIMVLIVHIVHMPATVFFNRCCANHTWFLISSFNWKSPHPQAKKHLVDSMWTVSDRVCQDATVRVWLRNCCCILRIRLILEWDKLLFACNSFSRFSSEQGFLSAQKRASASLLMKLMMQACHTMLRRVVWHVTLWLYQTSHMQLAGLIRYFCMMLAQELHMLWKRKAGKNKFHLPFCHHLVWTVLPENACY